MGKTESRIAEFVVETKEESIPQQAFTSAHRSYIDTVGVILAAAGRPVGQIISSVTAEEGGAGESTIIGFGARTTRSMAALANGTMAHALDHDDLGSGWGHCSSILVPTALALGEPEGASGRELLTAYAVAQEMGHHLARGQHYIQGEQGFHSTAVHGSLVAAALSARYLKLDVPQTVMALGIAGSMGGGVMQNFGTPTKGLHSGQASRNGVLAARLAQRGYKATDRVIESAAGWAAAHLGRGRFDVRAMVANLGNGWATADVIRLKRFPSCGVNHSPLESFFSLQREYKFRYDDVKRLEVDALPEISPVLMYPQPRDGFEAEFSLHHNMAAALLDGFVDHVTFDDEYLQRPELADAMAKVDVKVLTMWDSGYSSQPVAPTVRVHLYDGRVLARRTRRDEMPGSAATPLPREELEDKFRLNARLCLNDEQIDRALALWWSLPELSDVRPAVESVAAAAVPVG